MGLGSILRAMRKSRGAASGSAVGRARNAATRVGYRVDQRIADRLNDHPSEFVLEPGEAVVDPSAATLRTDMSGMSDRQVREAGAAGELQFETDVKLGNFLDRGLFGFGKGDGSVRTVGPPESQHDDWWDTTHQVEIKPRDKIVKLEDTSVVGGQRRGVFTFTDGMRNAGFTRPEDVGVVRQHVQRRARNYGLGVAGAKGWQAGENEVERRTNVNVPDPLQRSSQLVSQRFR